MMDRRDTVRALLVERGDLLVVAGLGAPAWDITAAGDTATNMPLWGAMGGTAMLGLGLALAQPQRRVLVLTGDGEMLMGLGALATIGVQRPGNLAIVVIDNERYGETGGQPTHTAQGVDLPAIAAAAGFADVRLVQATQELPALRAAIHTAPGPLFASIKVAQENAPLMLPPRDGALLASRFREALLGPACHLE